MITIINIMIINIAYLIYCNSLKLVVSNNTTSADFN